MYLGSVFNNVCGCGGIQPLFEIKITIVVSGRRRVVEVNAIFWVFIRRFNIVLLCLGTYKI